MNWIDKNEQMPEPAKRPASASYPPTSQWSERVLITNGLFIEIARIDLKYKICRYPFTHWLPLSALPELPKVIWP